MQLPSTFTKNEKFIHAVIETPKGSAAKYDFDPELQMFKLKKILPKGQVFPFHFGFIPFTKAEDGDPLDVLVLLNELSWPGCIVKCRLIGVMEATETEKNKIRRNDRLIAIANASDEYNNVKDLETMDPYLVEEIENFFNTYCNLQKKDFKVIAKKGPDVATDLIKKQLVHANNK